MVLILIFKAHCKSFYYLNIGDDQIDGNMTAIFLNETVTEEKPKVKISKVNTDFNVNYMIAT